MSSPAKTKKDEPTSTSRIFHTQTTAVLTIKDELQLWDLQGDFTWCGCQSKIVSKNYWQQNVTSYNYQWRFEGDLIVLNLKTIVYHVLPLHK